MGPFVRLTNPQGPMITTLCVMTCALATAQPTERSPYQLTPQLNRAQELVYRGSYSEDISGAGVQFQRRHRLEVRAFVLDVTPQGTDVAFLTLLRGDEDKAPPSSVRLEVARVEARGQIVSPAVHSLAVPLEGPTTIETGLFVEGPARAVGPGKSWEVAEAGRTTRTWQFSGSETINGTACVKVVGTQQSADWEQPRPERVAWRRKDTVWLLPRQGVAYRVERVVERRDPARRDATTKARTAYELTTSLQYPTQLFDDRRREIQQANQFALTAAALVPSNPKYRGQIDGLLTKIAFHIDNQ